MDEIDPPRVLVADASAETRAMLGRMISAADPRARVVEVANGRQIFAAIAQEHPTLAFVGLQFEDLSGPEAMAWAKAQGCPMPSLVLMASHVVPRWVEVSQRLEAYEFVKLPLDPRDIANLLVAHQRQRRPVRTLIVDGSAAGRQLVRRVLTRSTFATAIEETDDARHALKIMRLSHFDAALVEVGVPGLSALELACQARLVTPGTKLFLMSSGDIDELARVSRHFGVDFVLRKPFFPRDVDVALHKSFGLRRPYLLNALVADQPTGTLISVEPEAEAPLQAAAAR